MIGKAEVLRPLVEECLDDDPTVRPTIATVCERLQVNKDDYMKESPQECINVLEQNEQQKEIDQLRNENEMLRNETEWQRATIEQIVNWYG